VLVLDFEDPARDTADREFADATGIPAHALGAGDYDPSALERIDAAVRDAEDWAGRVDYHPELLCPSDALSLIHSSGAKLVILDYAQAMNADHGKTMERTLADFAWDLSSWSKANDAAAVVLSQVKSDVAERGQSWFARYSGEGWQKAVRGTRPGPGKADLAWCGALGERAKDLSYLWRPGRWARAFGYRDVKDDTLEIIKAKVSFGREGTIRLRFDGEHSRLSDFPE
jgi:replicative DNA helicase